MNPIKSIFIILISFLLSVFFGWEVYTASHPISDYETQIFWESNEWKIKKLQTVFQALWIYSWKIDGKYSSIESSLLNYQKKAGIIEHAESYGAWYFGKKTFEALEQEYWEKFSWLADQYLLKELPAEWERYFIVTAYYSPLPWQLRYTTGSYSGDIRLNWKWTHTASWKPVFTGLLAAPRNYKFGTKIFLEWIWIWSVEDRWWAIVNAGERGFSEDRIDIWMWYGDEWLNRALKWWKRKIKWQIVDWNYSVNAQFVTSPIEKYHDLKIDADTPNTDSVKKLQQLFSDIGLYSWEINGNFEDIRSILIDYQLEKNIIDSRDSYQAGHFWPKTLTALRKEFWVDWFFREPDTIVQWDILISKVRKEQLDRIYDILEKRITQKYGKNSAKNISYKAKIIRNIDRALLQTKSQKRKTDLKYLKILLNKQKN